MNTYTYLILLMFAIIFVIATVFFENRGAVRPWSFLGGAIASAVSVLTYLLLVEGIKSILGENYNYFSYLISFILALSLWYFFDTKGIIPVHKNTYTENSIGANIGSESTYRQTTSSSPVPTSYPTTKPEPEGAIAKPSASVSLKELKDGLAKINELFDKLDESLAHGEITEDKYKELTEEYRVEADNLKNQIAEKKFVHVGLNKD